MKKLLLVLTLLTTVNISAQKEDLAKKYATFIDSIDLKKHLSVLASDAYEGRETGKKGQQMAATYIEQSFKEDGCSFVPSMQEFQQSFEVIETVPGGSLKVGKNSLVFKNDYVYYGARKQVAFQDLDLITLAQLALEPKENYALIHSLKGMDIQAEVALIRKNKLKGAKAIVLITTNYEDLYEYLEHYATAKSMRLKEEIVKEELPIIIVNASALSGAFKKSFSYLLGKGKEKKPKKGAVVSKLSGTLNLEETPLKSSNVLAFIPGSDPILSKEVIVITAHYDHIGIENGIVYNGADDDGTGTVALLEIAEAFMQAKKDGNAPRRSILIMTVSGEEKGLLGSQYYVSHPIVSLEKTIADLNIDMIGRTDIAHESTPEEYIYIIGSNMLSTDLHTANEEANQRYTNIKLDYTFNTKNDPNRFYYRSDHYNFAKNNIPSIFYFSGIHEDYHQPGDDIEKIDFTKVETLARLVFGTAWILANADKRPRLDY